MQHIHKHKKEIDNKININNINQNLFSSWRIKHIHNSGLSVVTKISGSDWRTQSITLIIRLPWCCWGRDQTPSGVERLGKLLRLGEFQVADLLRDNCALVFRFKFREKFLFFED